MPVAAPTVIGQREPMRSTSLPGVPVDVPDPANTGNLGGKQRFIGVFAQARVLPVERLEIMPSIRVQQWDNYDGALLYNERPWRAGLFARYVSRSAGVNGLQFNAMDPTTPLTQSAFRQDAHVIVDAKAGYTVNRNIAVSSRQRC